MMSSNENTKELSLKRICAERYLYAIFYCVVAQYFLLALFLLFINTSLLHPILWMKQTAGLLFTMSTWFRSLPLISAVILHGIFLAKSHLLLKIFYRTQFAMLTQTAAAKTIFLVMQMLIGFLTAWLYSKFLHDDYRTLIRSCYDGESSCLSEKHLFITSSGLFAGAYYYFKVHVKESGVQFPVVQQSKYARVRACLWQKLKSALVTAFQPALCYLLVYSLLRSPIVGRLESLFRLDQDGNAGYFGLITDFRLLMYVWLLLAQILVNMDLMQALFEIFITERREFSIVPNAVVDPTGSDVLLVEALAADKLQIVQHLAALDFYELSDSVDNQRRKQFFELSNPGGHPHNWRHLSEECLRLIRNYTAALAAAVEIEKVVDRPAAPVAMNFYSPNPYARTITSPTKASDVAEKILNRQFNESIGIRSLIQDNYCASPLPTSCNVEDDVQHSALFDAIQKRIDECRKVVLNAPGFYYLFNESKNSKISFILTQSPTIVCVTKGLAALVAHSIVEDQYGVVQTDLAAIVKALLQTKAVLEKIGTVSVDVKKADRNFIALKTATRRALYRIATVFRDYIDDVGLDSGDLRAMQNFIFYKEL